MSVGPVAKNLLLRIVLLRQSVSEVLNETEVSPIFVLFL